MTRTTAMKEAQIRYRAKNKEKVNAINLKSALAGFNNDKELYLKHERTRSGLYYQKNKNYRHVDNMATSFKLLYGY
jgi:hypothetical protein